MNANANEIIKTVASKLIEISANSKTNEEAYEKAQAIRTSLFKVFEPEIAHILYTLGSKLAVEAVEA